MESLKTSPESELEAIKPLFCHDIRLPTNNGTNSKLSVQLLLVENQHQQLDDLDSLTADQVQARYLSLASRTHRAFRHLAWRIGLSRTRFGLDEAMVNLQFTINQPGLKFVRAILQAEASLETLLLEVGGNIHQRLLAHNLAELQPVRHPTDLDLEPAEDWSQLIVLDSTKGRQGLLARVTKTKTVANQPNSIDRLPKTLVLERFFSNQNRLKGGLSAFNREIDRSRQTLTSVDLTADGHRLQTERIRNLVRFEGLLGQLTHKLTDRLYQPVGEF